LGVPICPSHWVQRVGVLLEARWGPFPSPHRQRMLGRTGYYLLAAGDKPLGHFDQDAPGYDARKNRNRRTTSVGVWRQRRVRAPRWPSCSKQFSSSVQTWGAPHFFEICSTRVGGPLPPPAPWSAIGYISRFLSLL